MKQNYNYISDRLYPKFQKNNKKQNNIAQKQSEQSAINNPFGYKKCIEDHKLQNKLKSIIDNLENSIRQEEIMKNKKKTYRIKQIRQDDGLDDDFKGKFFRNKLRSPSHKSLHIGRLMKVKTQVSEARDQLQFQKKREKSQRTTTLGRQSSQSVRSVKTLALPKIKSQKKLQQISRMDQKQLILGKLVYQKVQKHFNKQKQGNQHYYDRVKSQQNIDSSLIQYLRHKVKIANLAVNPPSK